MLAVQPRERLSYLQQELALLPLMSMCEVPIEAKHALAKANLRLNAYPSATSVSLAMRLPEWRRRLQQDPTTLSKVVGHFDDLCSGGRGAACHDCGPPWSCFPPRAATGYGFLQTPSTQDGHGCRLPLRHTHSVQSSSANSCDASAIQAEAKGGPAQS